MLLDDVGSKLVTAIGLTLDTNLFLGRMPENPAAAVAIIETPGLLPVRTMGAAGPAEVEISGFQVMVRGAPDAYDTARITANAIWNVLASTTQETINAVIYHQFVAQSSPFSIGPNEEDQVQISCNYLAWKAPTP